MRDLLTRPVGQLLALICLLAGTSPGAAANSGDKYRVQVSEDLKQLKVSACFDQSPATLRAASSQAGRLIREEAPDNRVRLSRDQRHLLIQDSGKPGCISYKVDLRSVDEQGHWRREFVALEHAVLLSPGLFLWLPEHQTDVEIVIETAADHRVSTPWQQQAGSGNPHHYRSGPRDTDWTSKIALGRFDIETLQTPGAQLEVALLHGRPALNQTMVMQWLRANIKAIDAVYGHFPVPKVQVLVVPVAGPGKGSDPVPWGQVARGGGDSIHLYVDQQASAQKFMDDWVLSHELSHLFHPFLYNNARWLYEGLASYFQNLSRARSGLMSQRDAWESLHAGFERGIFNTRSGQNLQQASKDMMRERAFMRVYWSGAAIWLLADLELRRISQGEVGLDTVLNRLRACCLPSQRIWTADELIWRLDQLSDSEVFSQLSARHLYSDRFPDLAEAYRALGLVRQSATRLEFEQGLEQRRLRAAIMGEH